ncbi:MAG: glutamate synthase subunit beta [Deltaproteobacteria bacterium]
MGKHGAFITTKRETAGYRPKEERLKDYREVERRLGPDKIQEQGSRCMDCGVPFCHYACPVGNFIPDWNDLVFKGQWKKAVEILHESNPFPEFTGRVCPALCESACVVGLSDEPITIRQNEISIIEWGWENGVITPFKPKKKTGKSVAVVGGGPAGMACAQRLTRLGHTVTLFEADDKAGGILRYGIPDFKLEKWVIDRRLKQMQEEGLTVKTGVRVGGDISGKQLMKDFDAVALTIGARVPRDLKVEGRDLAGVHFAMDYLIQSNRRVAGAAFPPDKLIDAKGKDVIVIGGGDTGADCVGTANRQGARSVTQLELLPKPPLCRTKEMPWPSHPALLKTSSSHEEGCDRRWSITTRKFLGKGGKIAGLVCAQVDPKLKELPGTDFELKADLVVLAMGFIHPDIEGSVTDLKLKTGPRGTILTDKDLATSVAGVFAAGDAQRGASLVIWAIDEGLRCAASIDRFLLP